MVKILKLPDGREVIGEILSEDDYSIRMRDPLQISYFWNPPNIIPASVMSKYILFSEDSDIEFAVLPGMQVVQPKSSAIEFYHLTLLGYRASIESEIDQMLSAACFESGSRLAKEQSTQNVTSLDKARRMN